MKRKIETDIRLLRHKSAVIEPKEAQSIIKDLEDSLDLSKGIGLSAIQIGIEKRVGIIRIGKNKIDLINPKIIEKSEKFKFKGERCLSLPGLPVDTIRYSQIIVENNGKPYFSYGLEACAIQHEIDHMNGMLIIDRKWQRKK